MHYVLGLVYDRRGCLEGGGGCEGRPTGRFSKGGRGYWAKNSPTLVVTTLFPTSTPERARKVKGCVETWNLPDSASLIKIVGVKDVTNAGVKTGDDPDGANAIKRPYSPCPAIVDTTEEIKRTKR